MFLKPAYAIAIAEVNSCLEGLRLRYLPSVMSWLIFKNCSCALAHMGEVVRCLGGVLTSWKHRLVLLVFNALAAGHQARCISWKKKGKKKKGWRRKKG